MPSDCEKLHRWANSLPIFRFPFDATKVPRNGIYLLFEKGELAHGGNRIVRIGTHTGENQLPSRLHQHFLTENKDRSIFRKNVGRALLNKVHDPFLRLWEIDLTPAAARKKYGGTIDAAKLQEVEKRVSRYLRENFDFVALRVDLKSERLALESKMISTVSGCEECVPSKSWLGRFSPKEKIQESGLWLVNELYKEPLAASDLVRLMAAGGKM